MKERVLLTGVTGFLGSHLARQLLEEGYSVVALKRQSSSLRRVAAILPDLELVDSDGLDFDAFFRSGARISTVIHTATCYGRNNESVSEVFEANTEFPLRLLDAGSRAGVDLFVNTDTVLDKYLNLYALSKNQLLQWGKFFSLHDKIRFMNIRLEHFYGPDDDPVKFSTFVINSCLHNVPELQLTKGEQKRDFIYIDDVVKAYSVLMGNIHRMGENFMEFDVGSGNSVTIREFVETVHRLSSSATHLNFGALPYRDGEIMNSEADVSRLASLGWRCATDLETGLQRAIELERGRI